MSIKVTASDFSEIRWKGHWIWVPEDELAPSSPMPGQEPPKRHESHGLFRKGFNLETTPDRAPARITADSRYALYVNGQEVSRGPIRSQPRRMMYDLFDLAPYLKAGENTIAVYVKVFANANSFYIPPVPNSGLGKTGALVFEANLGETGWLVSDDSWKATKSHAWDVDTLEADSFVSAGVPVEILDARKLPVGWQAGGFDDSD